MLTTFNAAEFKAFEQNTNTEVVNWQLVDGILTITLTTNTNIYQKAAMLSHLFKTRSTHKVLDITTLDETSQIIVRLQYTP